MWLPRLRVGALLAALSLSLLGCTPVLAPEPGSGSPGSAEAAPGGSPNSSAEATGKWFYGGYDEVRRAAVNEPGRRGKQASFGMWGGKFDCPGSCQVGISIDDAPIQERAATMRDTTSSLELAAPEELWQSLLKARSLQVYYSAEGIDDVVEFDLTGIKAEKMPGF